jgi:hypothetical protein
MVTIVSGTFAVALGVAGSAAEYTAVSVFT